MSVIRAEQVTDACAQHGEGPIWDASAGCVRWVDTPNGDVLSMVPSHGVVSRLHVASTAAAIRPRVNGGLVVAVERGFALLDPGATEAVALPEIWSDPTVRMNDGACDPQGRFYCGSMAYDGATGRGAVYRLDPDRSVTTVLTDVTISNGLAWRPDSMTALYVDSPTRRIDELEFDPDAGTFAGRRTVITIDVDADPDGIALDVEGGVWVALWGGSAVHRYDDQGALAAVIELPVSQVTACALDPDDRLFITSSTGGVPGNPIAGALFCADVGVAGLPIGAYAG